MDANQIAAKIEEISGQQLDEEQRQEIKVWQRGRTLASIPPHAREEILAMMEGYVTADADAAVSAEPFTDDSRTKQAVAHVSAMFLARFTRDFDEAINVSRTPDIVKQSLRSVMQMPPESI